MTTIILGRNVKDTQCGFKLFSREAAKLLFTTQHLERWAFDMELLVLAGKQDIPIHEIGVNWQEIPGSKLQVIKDSIQMLRDIFMVRVLYMVGVW